MGGPPRLGFTGKQQCFYRDKKGSSYVKKDCPQHRSLHIRSRCDFRLPVRADILGRFLHAVRCKCHRGSHISEEFSWFRVPAFCSVSHNLADFLANGVTNEMPSTSYMYQKLDYGWGNSLLGFIAIAIGIPAPFLLWKFGAKLRARSQYAAGAQPK